MNLSVGILFAPQIHFVLHTPYMCGGKSFRGEYYMEWRNGTAVLRQDDKERVVSLPLRFEPQDAADAEFELKDVTIGIHFHWERHENQCFKGTLTIIREDGHLTAVNELDVEDYLQSVISSEMSAVSSLELLKAHAVISRSWVLAQVRGQSGAKARPAVTDAERIVWYDHDNHTHFDVCADDHCQRYQGITRANTPQVVEAVRATCGEVLLYGGEVCDARFSKSCGGIAEQYETCWDDTPHPYLSRLTDAPAENPIDLTVEANARAWITSSPEAFCNTTDRRILSQVLNDYDQETVDFYRWKVVYAPAELSALVARKSGIDFGEITDLQPVERGVSGRLSRLRIVGSRRTMVVGKELEIRKWLSDSHLYSSAFVVDRDAVGNFVLTGAGWGHGVGLCQIGAAVMASKGYDYRAILRHYYRGAEIGKITE